MNEEEVELRGKAQIIQDSVDWWEVQANDLFCEIDEIHRKILNGNSEKEDKRELEALYNQLETLIKRGRMESQNTIELEEEIKKFLSKSRED